MPLKMFEKKPILPLLKIGSVIGIAAGKGGVGKSSTTANIAYALKKAGHSVGILDADIYGPSIRQMMPEDTLPKQMGELIEPAVCQGIKIISMAYFRKEKEACAVRAPIANGVIGQFIKNINWGPLDYLLIDFPPGTGDIQLTICQNANLTGALIVTTPQQVALIDVRRAIDLFTQMHIPILGIVENMSYYQQQDKEKVYLFGQGGGRQLADEMGMPFLGEIPIDPLICECGDRGKSLYDIEEKAKTSINAFHEVTKNLIAKATFNQSQKRK